MNKGSEYEIIQYKKVFDTMNGLKEDWISDLVDIERTTKK